MTFVGNVAGQVGGPAIESIDPFADPTGIPGDGQPAVTGPDGAAVQPQQKTADEVYAEAQAMFDAENFVGTIQICNSLLRQAPQMGEFYYLKGRSLAALGENELALSELTNAESYMRSPAFAAIEKGKIYYEQRNYKNASQEFSKAVSFDPLNLDSLLRRGKSQLKLAQISLNSPSLFGTSNTGLLVEQAISSFERVVGADPQNAEAYSELARARAMMRESDEAIDDANRAMQLAPSDVQYAARAGVAYQTRANEERAKRYNKNLDQAVADYHHAIEAFSRFLEAKGDPRMDQSEFEDDPDAISPQTVYQYRISAYIGLAEVTFDGGAKYYQKSINDCNRLLEYKDGSSEVKAAALLQRGISQRMLGDTEASFESYNDAIKLAGSIPDALIRRGILYFHQNDLDSAMADFEEAKAQPSSLGDVRAKFWSGVVYAQWGDFNDAIREYSSALRINPNYKPARSNRGLALMRAGRYRQAAVDFAVLVQQDPTDQVSRSRRDEAHRLLKEDLAAYQY